MLVAGGKGINVSKALTNLGLPNIALGLVGGSTGNLYLQKLDDIRTDFSKYSGNTRINVKLKDDQSELGINADNDDIQKKHIKNLFAKLKQVKLGDFVCLCGSAPKNLGTGIYAEIMERLEDLAFKQKVSPSPNSPSTYQNNINVVVDATRSLLLETILYQPFLIKPNLDEIRELSDKPIDDTVESIVPFAQKLQRLGAKNVLVSRGSKGAILLQQDGQILVEQAIQGKVISTVGAGDAMVAGFVAGVVQNKTMRQSLQLSIAAGSATAFCQGIASKEQIEERYQQLTTNQQP